MARTSKIPNTEAWRETLRAAGLRSTAPRIAVLGALHRASVPLSHADVCEALAETGFDRATLYRNLVDLAEAGLVTRSDLGHVWRFELRPEGAKHEADHPHFTCTDCGEVECLPGVSVRISGRLPKSVRGGAVEIQLRGVCAHCG